MLHFFTPVFMCTYFKKFLMHLKKLAAAKILIVDVLTAGQSHNRFKVILVWPVKDFDNPAVISTTIKSSADLENVLFQESKIHTLGNRLI